MRAQRSKGIVMGQGQRVLITPAYAGVSLLFSWIYLLFYAQSAGIEAAAPVSLMSAGYTISALFMSATLLVLAFCPFRRVEFLTSSVVKAATPLGMSLGTLVLIASGSGDDVALLWVGGITTGVTSGIMAQQWAVAYSRVGLKAAACSFPILMAASVGICATLMYLPSSTMILATIALPAISGMMFHMVRKDVQPHYELELGPRDRPANFTLLLFPVAIYSLSTGFLDHFSGNSYYAFAFYAIASFVPLGIAGAFAFVAARESFFASFVLPLCFLVVVFVPFFSLSGVAPLSQFVSIGELGIEVVLFVVAVGFADYFSLGALKSYALTRTVVVLFNALGWYAAAFFEQTFNGLVNAQASLVVVFVGVEVLAICLVIAIVKARKTLPHDRGSCEAFEPSGELGETKSQGNTSPAKASETLLTAQDALADDSDASSRSGESHSAHMTTSQMNALSAATPSIKAEPVSPAEYGASSFDDRCQGIGNRFGLSEREVDVLRLLARGYSSSSIQSELFIAAGTVNYHTRNVYAKLGVHSKQEVIDLVDSWSVA